MNLLWVSPMYLEITFAFWALFNHFLDNINLVYPSLSRIQNINYITNSNLFTANLLFTKVIVKSVFLAKLTGMCILLIRRMVTAKKLDVRLPIHREGDDRIIILYCFSKKWMLKLFDYIAVWKYLIFNYYFCCWCLDSFFSFFFFNFTFIPRK